MFDISVHIGVEGADAAGRQVDQFGKTSAAALNELNAGIGVLKSAFVALGGVWSVGWAVGLISDAIEAKGRLYDLSLQTGVSVEGLGSLAKVALYSGTQLTDIASASNKLSKALYSQNEDSKGAAAGLKALGFDFNTFKGLKPEEQMLAIAKAMDGFQDGAGKSATAMALFGKTGATLLPFLKEFAERGMMVTKQTTAGALAAKQFADDLVTLKGAGEGFVYWLAGGMLPTLATFATRLNAARDAYGGFWAAVKDSPNFSPGKSLNENIGATIAQYTALEEKANGIRTRIAAGGRFVAYDTNALAGVAAEQKVLDQRLAYLRQLQLADGGGRGTVNPGDKAKGILSPELGGDIAPEKIDKMAVAYANWSKRIREKTAETELEMQAGVKLTDGQKMAVDLMEELRTGTLVLADAKKIELTRELERNLAAEKWLDTQRAEKKLQDEIGQDRLKIVEDLQKQTATLQEQVDAQQKANDELRYGKAYTEAKEAADLRETATLKELTAATSDQSAELMKQAALLRKRADLLQDNAVVREAKAAAEEWAKTADQIGQGLTDSLFRAFEAGRGFFSTLWQGIVNTFKTTILRPTIQAIMAPVTGGIGSLFGSGGAQAGTGGGILGSLGSAGSLLGSIGGAAGLFGTGAMATLGGTGLGSLLGASGAMIGNGSILGGASLGAGAVAPYLLAAYAAYTLLSQKRGGPKDSGSAGIADQYRYADSGSLDAAMQTMLAGTNASYAATAKGLGISQSKIDATKFGLFGSLDPKGTSSNQAVIQSSIGGALAYNTGTLEDGGRGQDALTKTLVEHTAQAMLATLKASGLSAESSAYLASHSGLTATAEGVNKVLATLVDVRALTTQLAPLGGVFSRLASLSVDARENMIALAGGMQALGAQAKSFAEQYYQTDELAGLKAREIVDALAAVGITQDIASKDEFRKLVEGRDVGTEQGRTQLATLLGVSDSFAGLADYLTSNGKTLDGTAQQAPAFDALGSIFESGATQQVAATNNVNTTLQELNALVARLVAGQAAGGATVTVNAPSSWEVTAAPAPPEWASTGGP